jgi:SpoVK/Ycf46/Vps4 family AAA+-type ATPase
MSFNRIEKTKDNRLLFTSMPDFSNLSTEIPKKVYKVGFNFMTDTHWLIPVEILTEGLIPLEEPASKELLDFITEFFTEETKNRYKRYDILYRSGVLLHGVPGTGKTYAIHRVREAAVAAGYIVLLDPNPNLVSKFVEAIRTITQTPEQSFLVIWEELDSYLDNFENKILELLDGNSTMENIIYIGTTNYIDKIPDRLKSRPSRFNRIVEVKTPTENMRREYFNAKLHADDKSKWLEPMVAVSEGLVLDFCKELILSVLVYNRPLQTEANRLKTMAKIAVTEEEEEEAEKEIEEEAEKCNDQDCKTCYPEDSK